MKWCVCMCFATPSLLLVILFTVLQVLPFYYSSYSSFSSPIPGLFKVALSVLGSLQTRLLELEDFESIVMLMREWKREGNFFF